MFKEQCASKQGKQKLSGLFVCLSIWLAGRPPLLQLDQIFNFRITTQILIKSSMIWHRGPLQIHTYVLWLVLGCGKRRNFWAGSHTKYYWNMMSTITVKVKMEINAY